MRIRREDEIGYEKDIIEKCKDEPKLFYRFINGKTRIKEKVEKLRDGDKIIEDPKEMCELLNEKYQHVFMKQNSVNLNIKL